jgi:hypothetical protein
MNALQIKTFLWKNGLTISGIATDIHTSVGLTFDSCRNALTRMFYHGDYNAELAKIVRDKYGIKVDRPAKPQTVREALKAA